MTLVVHSARMAELQAMGRWPGWLPKDYTELHQQFGAFVICLIRKHNKVDNDPRDLINHIWKEFLRVDMLTKYVDAACSEHPETSTTEEACEFLGISRKLFGIIAMKRLPHERRLPTPISGTYNSIYAVWRRSDIVEFSKVAGFKKIAPNRTPLPNTETVTSKQVYAYLGVNHPQFKTHFWSNKFGYPCKEEDQDKLDPIYEGLGPLTPINAGYHTSLSKAIWKYEDIVALHQIIDHRRQDDPDAVPAKLSAPKVSKSHFNGYFARTVHNIFVNWCRTRTRRHKEQTGDCFPQLHPVEGDPTSWEDRLPGDACTRIEDQADILHLAHRVQKTLPGREIEVLTKLDEGYSLAEAIESLNGLTAVRKRIAIRILRPI